MLSTLERKIHKYTSLTPLPDLPDTGEPLADRIARFTGGAVRAQSAAPLMQRVSRFTGAIQEDRSRATSPGLQEEDKEQLAENYAFVPDPQEPSTWKLPIFDRKHVAMAAEALSSSGFRGRRVQIPESARAAVKARIRAAWRKFNRDKSDDEMPESIRESSDGDDSTAADGDWLPSSQAAADATARAHELPEGDPGLKNAYMEASMAHMTAGREATEADVKKAHRASATAHLASANTAGLADGAVTAADHRQAATMHGAAEHAWHRASGGKFGLGRAMADEHSEQREWHDQVAAEMDGSDMAGELDDNEMDDNDNGTQEDDFQEAWSPQARAAAIARRRLRALAAMRAAVNAGWRGNAKAFHATIRGAVRASERARRLSGRTPWSHDVGASVSDTFTPATPKQAKQRHVAAARAHELAARQNDSAADALESIPNMTYGQRRAANSYRKAAAAHRAAGENHRLAVASAEFQSGQSGQEDLAEDTFAPPIDVSLANRIQRFIRN